MSQKPEARSQEPEVRIQTPEARSQTPEVIHLHQNVANLEDSKNRMAGYFVKVAFMLLSLLGLLFLILSLATDYWSKVEGQHYEGLFQVCFVKNDICLKIRFDLLKGKVGRKFKAVIVMMILAVSAQGCAIFVAIMSLIKKKNKTLVIFVASLKGAADGGVIWKMLMFMTVATQFFVFLCMLYVVMAHKKAPGYSAVVLTCFACKSIISSVLGFGIAGGFLVVASLVLLVIDLRKIVADEVTGPNR